jgi:hypothetical protein
MYEFERIPEKCLDFTANRVFFALHFGVSWANITMKINENGQWNRYFFENSYWSLLQN